MVQTLLWQLLLILLRIVLEVGKDFITAAIKAVTEAEDKKHDDGTPLTGPEKKAYVMGELIKAWSQEEWVTKGQRITNLVVEAVVNYIKSRGK